MTHHLTTENRPVIAARAKSMVQRYNRIVRWLNAIHRHLDDGAVHPYDAPKGDQQRVRMPSKQQKGWMYDDAYVVARALGLDPNSRDLNDVRNVAVHAKEVLGTIRKIETPVR